MANCFIGKRIFGKGMVTVGYIIFLGVIFSKISQSFCDKEYSILYIIKNYWIILPLLIYFMFDWLSSELIPYIIPEGKFTTFQVLGGFTAVCWLTLIITICASTDSLIALKSFAFYSFIFWFWDIELYRKYFISKKGVIPFIDIIFFVWIRGSIGLLLVFYTIILIAIFPDSFGIKLTIIALFTSYVFIKIVRYFFLLYIVEPRNI